MSQTNIIPRSGLALGLITGLLAITGCQGSPGTLMVNGVPIEPDPPEAAAVLNRTPGTVAYADLGEAKLCTAIDNQRNTHQYILYPDDNGSDYVAEYEVTSDVSRLGMHFDKAGTLVQFRAEDRSTGDWARFAVDWKDSGRAKVSMTTRDQPQATTFDYDPSQQNTADGTDDWPADDASDLPGEGIDEWPEDWPEDDDGWWIDDTGDWPADDDYGSTWDDTSGWGSDDFYDWMIDNGWLPKLGEADAEAADYALAKSPEENRLSLRIKVRLVDGAGYPVSELRPTFKLRYCDDTNASGAILGVASGSHIDNGEYAGRLPAYRYEPDDLPDFIKSVICDSVSKSATYNGFILFCTTNWVGGMAYLTIASFGGQACSDYLGSGVEAVTPHPSPIASESVMQPPMAPPVRTPRRVVISVNAGDRKQTTAESPVMTVDQLVSGYIEPGYLLDMGTLVVEPFSQPGAVRFRVYLVNIGPGQLEVLPDGSEDEDVPLCQFAGGGRDCSVMAQVDKLTEEAYSTRAEAIASLCGEAKDVKMLPLGVGPAGTIRGQYRYLSSEVYSNLLSCPK